MENSAKRQQDLIAKSQAGAREARRLEQKQHELDHRNLVKANNDAIAAVIARKKAGLE